MNISKMWRRYKRRAWKKRILRLRKMYGSRYKFADACGVRKIKPTWSKQMKYIDSDPNGELMVIIFIVPLAILMLILG